ncbi:hypothetical protein [Paraburkholderia fynbosensis]|uniref:Response regulatory domain-containing protein n=1 Tax=Paraburkholderia fynbosensis TaxID=1200993 RepID=A0A6J5H2Z1_9BURK|nr:hypothetical protein [Paraburkholderia fynbosensis]CAB3809613.1 hypothetical protein LMG27177_06850 [Paraburkholderia fynbosensis]
MNETDYLGLRCNRMKPSRWRGPLCAGSPESQRGLPQLSHAPRACLYKTPRLFPLAAYGRKTTDDPDSRGRCKLASSGRAVERLQRLSGFHTRPFRSAEDADVFEFASTARCLVIDVNLPGTSEPAFYAMLDLPRPPAVFMTAFNGARTRRAVESAGAHTLLTKPFPGEPLVDAVAKRPVAHLEGRCLTQMRGPFRVEAEIQRV